MLVGLSGSGKTTTGNELEQQCGLKNFDVDLEIERETKKSIAQIIRVEGEKEFRRREVEMLQRAFSLPIDCIAMGAGALNERQNREHVKNDGFMIWLCGSAVELESRLHKDDSSHIKRPFLAQRTQEERIQMLKQMEASRKVYYSEAPLKIWTDYVGPKTVAQVAKREWVNSQNDHSAVIVIPHSFFQGFSQDDKHSLSEVVIGSGVITSLATRISAHWPKATRVMLVTDETLCALYGKRLEQIFAKSALMLVQYVVPVGEREKSLITVQLVTKKMLRQQFTRDDVVVAFGGGVVGDVGGLIASLYARGVGLVQIPTTIVAQVDSAIGGKTAVNLVGDDAKQEVVNGPEQYQPLGKNILGTFYPARLILSEVEFLKTLPEREFVSGLAEVLKYGLIQDKVFFEWVAGEVDNILGREEKCLIEIVEFCSRTKLNIVLDDMTDIQGKRILLNFGHTFGHALEVKSGFTELLHGEAIAVGMMLATLFGESVGITPVGTAEKLRTVLRSFRLPVGLRELPGSDKFLPGLEQLKSEEVRSGLVRSFDDAIRADKKRSADVVKEVLLIVIGKPIVREVRVEELVNFICGVALR